MMRVHPRTLIVTEAGIALDGALTDIVQKHDLTFTEIAIILTRAQASWLKYALRAERHPDDADKGGDEA